MYLNDLPVNTLTIQSKARVAMCVTGSVCV